MTFLLCMYLISSMSRTARIERLARDLRISNEDLQEEISERGRAEQALQRAHDELEERVSQRTVELTRSSSTLQEEIAERRQAERDLENRALELARSNAELEQFAYVASHDLQEPLRAVAGFSKMLGRRYEGQLGPDADRLIRRTVNAAQRMQGLIDDLLTYSRVGRDVGDLEPIDCDAVVDEVLDSLQPFIKETKAVVTRDPLPAVTASFSLLTQVFCQPYRECDQIPSRAAATRACLRRAGRRRLGFLRKGRRYWNRPAVCRAHIRHVQEPACSDGIPRHRYRSGDMQEGRRILWRANMGGIAARRRRYVHV